MNLNLYTVQCYNAMEEVKRKNKLTQLKIFPSKYLQNDPRKILSNFEDDPIKSVAC